MRARRDRGEEGRRPAPAEGADGAVFYTWVATSSFYREYLRNPVRMRLAAGDRELEGITVLAQNSDPFTYFGGRPVRVCSDVAIDNGTIAIAVLRRAAQRDMRVRDHAPSGRGLPATEHRQIDHVAGVTEGVVESLSTTPGGEPRPFPVQVDGDYIGDHARLELGVEPARADRRCLTTASSARSRGRDRGGDRLRGRALARLPRLPAPLPRPQPADPARAPRDARRPPRRADRALFAHVRLLSEAVRDAMGAQGSFVANNNVVSQSVPHLHFHIVPRVRKDGLRGFFWPRRKYKDGEMAAAAEAIRAELA